MVQIKRIYAPAEPEDGFRVLIDRLWPRGVSRASAALDLWLKDIAPSSELRTWFGHKPENFEKFAAKYKLELADNPAVGELGRIMKQHPTVTLLYAAHNEKINHARVLLDFLRSKS